MTKLLNLVGYNKPKVSGMLSLSLKQPKEIINRVRKGVVFSGFDDWLLAARKANAPSPYALFWRHLALEYPVTQVVQSLPEFLQVFSRHPEVADQARALLLLIPAKKLPSVRKLRSLEVKTTEAGYIKTLLIRKKMIGDKYFAHHSFLSVVRRQGEDKIVFPLENGKIEVRSSRLFSQTEIPVMANRLSTVYGEATVILTDEQSEDDTEPIFLVFDGTSAARKIYPLELKKIRIER